MCGSGFGVGAQRISVPYAGVPSNISRGTATVLPRVGSAQLWTCATLQVLTSEPADSESAWDLAAAAVAGGGAAAPAAAAAAASPAGSSCSHSTRLSLARQAVASCRATSQPCGPGLLTCCRCHVVITAQARWLALLPQAVGRFGQDTCTLVSWFRL